MARWRLPVEALACRRRVVLVVAHAAVHEDGEAKDVLHRTVLGNVPALPSDHDRDLSFEIELRGHTRPQDRFLMCGTRREA